MTMRKRRVREQFSRLALEHDEALDVVRGAVLIAAEDDESADVESVLATLAKMGDEARHRIGEIDDPRRQMNALAEYLHVHIGLAGNKKSYYDPKNSFVHEVLTRKMGIPITLAVIYIAVGRAAGLHLVGVGLPAHFLIGVYAGGIDRSRLPDWFVDPFAPTQLMNIEDCKAFWARMGGAEATFRTELLAAATHRQILARMLTNLKLIYARTGEPEKAIAAIDRLLLLNPNVASEYRDRGVLHMQLDLYSLALDDFTRYLATGPGLEDSATVEQAISELKSRIAMLH